LAVAHVGMTLPVASSGGRKPDPNTGRPTQMVAPDSGVTVISAGARQRCTSVRRWVSRLAAAVVLARPGPAPAGSRKTMSTWRRAGQINSVSPCGLKAGRGAKAYGRSGLPTFVSGLLALAALAVRHPRLRPRFVIPRSMLIGGQGIST